MATCPSERERIQWQTEHRKSSCVASIIQVVVNVLFTNVSCQTLVTGICWANTLCKLHKVIRIEFLSKITIIPNSLSPKVAHCPASPHSGSQWQRRLPCLTPMAWDPSRALPTKGGWLWLISCTGKGGYLETGFQHMGGSPVKAHIMNKESQHLQKNKKSTILLQALRLFHYFMCIFTWLWEATASFSFF